MIPTFDASLACVGATRSLREGHLQNSAARKQQGIGNSVTPRGGGLAGHPTRLFGRTSESCHNAGQRVSAVRHQRQISTLDGKWIGE